MSVRFPVLLFIKFIQIILPHLLVFGRCYCWCWNACCFWLLTLGRWILGTSFPQERKLLGRWKSPRRKQLTAQPWPIKFYVDPIGPTWPTFHAEELCWTNVNESPSSCGPQFQIISGAAKLSAWNFPNKWPNGSKLGASVAVAANRKPLNCARRATFEGCLKFSIHSDPKFFINFSSIFWDS